MKINCIQNIKNNNNKLSFNGRSEIHERIVDFTHDIVKLSLKENVSQGKVERLIKKYVPNLIIINKKNNDIASCSIIPKYNKHCQKYLGNGLCINIPRINYQSKTQKIDMVENITHELTHALQNKDNDLSIINLLNSTLESKGYDKTNKLYIISNSVVNQFENKYIKEAHKHLEVTNIVECLSAKTPEKLFELMNVEKIDFIDFFKKRIHLSIKETKKEFPDFDETFFLKHLKNLAITEEDAYREGICATKIMSNNKNISLDEAIPLIYQKLSKAIDEFKS